MRPAVVWHDVECHAYAADLALWHELAERETGPVLDVGAGTGRVALDLAAAGHAVTALDVDGDLLAALCERAGSAGLEVATVEADAQAFHLDTAFGLILVPMQTLQLLADRRAFLRAARAHLAPGGLLAAAIVEDLLPFEPDPALLPDPDVTERDGWRYASQPVAVREVPGATRIERRREATAPDGTVTVEPDAIELAMLTAPVAHAEGIAAGLRPEPSRHVDATADHVGSVVVMLRG